MFCFVDDVWHILCIFLYFFGSRSPSKNTLLVNFRHEDVKSPEGKKTAKESTMKKRSEEMKEEFIRSRYQFLERASENPLYTNDELPEPWKVVGRYEVYTVCFKWMTE